MGQTETIAQLRAAGYENIYTKDGKILVATGDAAGKGFDQMMPAEEALASKAPAMNPPKKVTTGGQGGKGKNINRARQNQYASSMGKVLGDDDFRRMMREQASDMGGFESTMVHAGREVDKLGAGLADIADVGRGMFGEDILTNLDRRDKRAEDQAYKDKAFEGLDMESSFSGIGAMLPYMVTGVGSAPIATAAGRGIQAAGRGAGRVAGTTGRAAAAEAKTAADIIKSQYKKIQPKLPPKMDEAIQGGLQKVGNKYQTEIGKPLEDALTHIKNRGEIPNAFRGNPLQETIGAGTLGAVEGGAHYDEIMGEGALSSILGYGSGKAVKNKLSQAPNLNSPGENAIIDKWKKMGYRPSPGMETGLPEIQKVSSNARTDSKFASGVKGYDDANLDVISKVAAEASGMDAKVLRNITPDEMKAHVGDLKAQYEAMEAKTSGIPNQDSLDEVTGLLDDYSTPVQNKLMRIIESMEGGYEGKEYKNIRKEVKDAYNAANQHGKDEKDAYRILLDTLDDSIEAGIEASGEGLSQQWRDLNEKYAMTHFMLNNGMNAAGGIEPKKIATKLMSTDAERLLTGRGGRIGKFHDIAQISAIESKQAGGGLGNMNVDALPGDEVPGLFSTPSVAQMGPLRAAKFQAFMKGYPNKTGLANLPRAGVLSTERLGAAAQQGTDNFREIPDIAEKARKYIEDILQGREAVN